MIAWKYPLIADIRRETQLGRQKLQCHLAPQATVLGEKNLAHAPAADFFNNPVMINLPSDHRSLRIPTSGMSFASAPRRRRREVAAELRIVLIPDMAVGHNMMHARLRMIHVYHYQRSRSLT